MQEHSNSYFTGKEIEAHSGKRNLPKIILLINDKGGIQMYVGCLQTLIKIHESPL